MCKTVHNYCDLINYKFEDEKFKILEKLAKLSTKKVKKDLKGLELFDEEENDFSELNNDVEEDAEGSDDGVYVAPASIPEEVHAVDEKVEKVESKPKKTKKSKKVKEETIKDIEILNDEIKKYKKGKEEE